VGKVVLKGQIFNQIENLIIEKNTFSLLMLYCAAYYFLSNVSERGERNEEQQ